MSTRLKVRVQPGSSRNEVVLSEDGSLRVYVTAAPEGGKANKAMIALLSKALGVARSGITIAKGHASRDKLVVVEGVGSSEVRTRVSAKR